MALLAAEARMFKNKGLTPRAPLASMETVVSFCNTIFTVSVCLCAVG